MSRLNPVPHTPLRDNPTEDSIWKRYLEQLWIKTAAWVSGPSSSTDNAVPRFNGTDGIVLQNSGVIIDDSNNVTGAASVTATTFNGALNGNASTATLASTVTVADAAADTSMFVMLAGAATGSLPVLTDAGIAYNANTNALTVGSVTVTSSTAPTNGLYLPAANSVSISTNSAEAMRFDSSGMSVFGSVGISGAALLVATGSTGTAIVQLGPDVPSSNDAGRITFLNSNVVSNWRIGHNLTIGSSTFEIIPSTVAGGSTFSTAVLGISAAGRLTLPTTGSGAGILIGGDALLYRSAADTLRTPDSLTVDVDLLVSGAATVTGDLAVNGGDITTSATTFNLLNATVTTFNIGGAATTLTVGGTPTGSITANLITNATANGNTKTINLGTGGAAGSTTNINMGSASGGTVILNRPARLMGYTVATLPAGTQGDVAFVTDALAPAFITAVVGGGTIVTPVFYNGTVWVAG